MDFIFNLKTVLSVKKIRKNFTVLLLLVMVFILNTGCGGSDKAQKENIDLLPKYRTAEEYYNLATVAGQNGKIDMAIANFKKAIEINPASAESYASLGLAYAKKNDIPNAILNYLPT